ncbi:MAG: hypothetical protein GYA66_11535, partial [Phyllobacteriaceae bacterium]|nr:hypothetical protein [Phyllobacteriaceae bacterium]
MLVGLGIAAGVGTFLVLTGMTPIRPDGDVVFKLLLINGCLAALIAAMVLSQVFLLLRERRQGTAGAGLHIRLISLFSVVAVAPALLVAAFATVTLKRGLDTWYSETTRSIVDSAVVVAEDYLANAGEATRADLASMSTDLTQQLQLFNDDRPAYVRRVARHAALRNLAAAYVFEEGTKRIDANVTANERIKFLAPNKAQIDKARKGDAVIIQPGPGENLVRALVKLQGYRDHYLYIYRLISPVVIDQLAKTRAAKAQYDAASEQQSGILLTFALVYGVL